MSDKRPLWKAILLLTKTVVKVCTHTGKEIKLVRWVEHSVKTSAGNLELRTIETFFVTICIYLFQIICLRSGCLSSFKINEILRKIFTLKFHYWPWNTRKISYCEMLIIQASKENSEFSQTNKIETCKIS